MKKKVKEKPPLMMRPLDADTADWVIETADIKPEFRDLPFEPGDIFKTVIDPLTIKLSEVRLGMDQLTDVIEFDPDFLKELKEV